MFLPLVSVQASRLAGIKFIDLPPLPVTKGLAGVFAGVSHGTLLVAGGSNFPDKNSWEGGTKAWYKDVYGYQRGKWKRVGSLPEPLGYGVSVTYRNRLIFVGGSDKAGCHRSVFSLEFKQGVLRARSLPSLPIPLSLDSGTVVGSNLLIAGGQISPASRQANDEIYEIDLAKSASKWRLVSRFPGPSRILGFSASANGAFWYGGGAELIPNGNQPPARRYLTDFYRFDPIHSWQKMADLPYPTLAAPSPIPATGGKLFVFGGDDGSHPDFKPIQKHPGFSRKVMTYDIAGNLWKTSAPLPFSRVVMPAVRWKNGWVFPGGETQPGVRTATVTLVIIQAT